MQLSPIFGDGMVFAAGKPIRVFGTHEGIVTAEVGGATAECQAHGDFLLALPALPAGGPHDLTIRTSDGETVIRDVWIGDVYLFSGQSNMSFTLGESETPEAEYGKDDGVRFYNPDTGAGWEKCTPETAVKYSAIAHHVLLAHRARTGRAAGAVIAAQGASVIESWLPAALAASPAFRLPPEAKAPDHTMPEYASWNGNGVLYEKYVRAIAPFSFTGVIWYQGESDVTVAEGEIYDRELTAMINAWRRDFRDAMLPFLLVQIAETPEGNLSYWPPEGWQAIRDAQTRVAEAAPRVSMVVSRDLGTPVIHPPDKRPLAARIEEAL